MKILFVADIESAYYYEYYKPGRLADFDLIISCGDLSRHYLEFLVTMARCPLLYVPGNHDEAYVENPPEGCICIDGKIFEYQGIRFLGLGGSNRYRPDATYMYTERQMRHRIRKLWLKIMNHRGFDVLVTHAPAYQLGDLNTVPHRGFQCFRTLMETYKPKLMVHGHVHANYGLNIPREREYMDTKIINVYDSYVLEL